MPVDPYTPVQGGGYWNYLTNKMPFLGEPFATYSGLTHQSLVSYAFTKDIPLPNPPGRSILPHSVLKHTINIHCYQPKTLLNKVTSFSWYTDNTRGRMRFYPFISSNDPNGGQSQYDIIFLPDFVGPQGGYDINGAPNHTMNYSTLNYYPSNQAINLCNCPLPETNLPTLGGTYGDYVYPADYLLLSAHPRSEEGEFLAGFDYVYNNTTPDIVTKKPGAIHYYRIDKGYPDLDLTWINANEKVIYNPSEVSVVSNAAGALTNLVFPSLYTFKTILGVYPSVDEVNDANTVENGGPYADPRDVPVPVNAFEYMPVGSQLSKYPHVSWDDPMTPIDERFGYYYIEENGEYANKC
jgi:hypothetical protein